MVDNVEREVTRILFLGREVRDIHRDLLAMGFGEYVVAMHIENIDPLNPLKDIDLNLFDAVLIDEMPIDRVARILSESLRRGLPLYMISGRSLRLVKGVELVADEVARA